MDDRLTASGFLTLQDQPLGALPAEVSYLAWLIPENLATDDGRFMMPDSLRWRDPPLPVMASDRNLPAHLNALLVANLVLPFERRPDPNGVTWVVSNLTWDSDPEAQEFKRMVDCALEAGDCVQMRGLSVDLAVMEADVREDPAITEDPDQPPQEAEPEPLADADWPEGVWLRVRDGVIMGATIVPMPAFADARIEPLVAGATPFRDLPLSERARAWDGAAAEGRVFGPADQPNWTRARRGHFWVDDEAARARGAASLRDNLGICLGCALSTLSADAAAAVGLTLVDSATAMPVTKGFVGAASNSLRSVSLAVMPSAQSQTGPGGEDGATTARSSTAGNPPPNINAGPTASGLSASPTSRPNSSLSHNSSGALSVAPSSPGGNLTAGARGLTSTMITALGLCEACSAEAAISASDASEMIRFSSNGRFATFAPQYAKGDFKLPFADVIGGALTAVWNGVTAATAAMRGSRGGVNIPDADRGGVESHQCRYYDKARQVYNDDSIQCPHQAASMTADGYPVAPPAEWFEDPRLTRPTGLTITDEGRVFGHLAVRDTCHVGLAGCTRMPEGADLSKFLTGLLVTADGLEIPVGQIIVAGGHHEDYASNGRLLTLRAVQKAYADTRSAGADVTMGFDEWGTWIAGALRPGVTEEQLRIMRASPLSGHWRWEGNREYLIAAACVNNQGLPIPRALVASGNLTSVITVGPDPERPAESPETPAVPPLVLVAAAAPEGLEAAVWTLVETLQGALALAQGEYDRYRATRRANLALGVMEEPNLTVG